MSRRGPTILQLFSRSVEVEPACGEVETGGIGWLVGCAVSRDGCVVWRHAQPDATGDGPDSSLKRLLRISV